MTELRFHSIPQPPSEMTTNYIGSGSLLLVFFFGFIPGFSFAFGYGLTFGSVNFSNERLGLCRNRHFAQQ